MPEFAGEKTEQPTTRRLEEAVKHGQFPRSAEVQTVFVLLAGLIALKMTGDELWRQIQLVFISTLAHLHDVPLTQEAMPHYVVRAALVLAGCVSPMLVATAIGGLLAGGIQNRFQTASEALSIDWQRVNPVEGLKRVFSMRSAAPTAIAALKLATVILLSYSEIHSILTDSTLYSVASVVGIATFVINAALGITWRIIFGLILIAVVDYTYQFWQTNRDLMMTKEEVKEEAKSSEGNPQMKARQRRRRGKSVRQMLLDVPKADVVVTNPTHLAVALRYDRNSMKAPRIIAKGSRLNALRIREVAGQHGIPILENKPLARAMFKYGRVGGEIPAQLYVAVAEVLAYVYRVNRSRYYLEANQVASAESVTTNSSP